MLELLRIKNLALIEDAEIEFSQGMNVLTGETGAGKSFILRAIDFLTGERMGKDLVRPGKDKAQVEALFALPDKDLVIRRELSAETGRSRVYVNDSLSSQEAIKELRPSLVVHTSQHGQQKLLSPAFQADILDGFVPDQGLVARKDQLLAELRGLMARRSEVQARSAELQSRREFLEYQKAEIDKVAPRHGEEAALEEKKHALKDAEQARQAQERALSLLAAENGLRDQVSQLGRDLADMASAQPDLAPEQEAVEEFRLRLADLEARLRKRDPELEGESLDRIEARLFELSRLKRKLGRGLEEIVGLSAEIGENLSFLDACGLDLARLSKEEKAKAGELGQTLEALNQARAEAAAELCARLEAELRQLGFSEHVRVRFQFEAFEPYPGLAEQRGRLLWVPNPGQAPQPLDRIASGGELSRFLLALVSLRAQGVDERPSLLFDEVDAGIGGLVLDSLGRKLKDLSGRQQVLLITHWPQLAALADRHFRIAKEVVRGETHTRCQRLPQDEIFAELSRMAGGGDKGDALAAQLVPR